MFCVYSKTFSCIYVATLIVPSIQYLFLDIEVTFILCCHDSEYVQNNLILANREVVLAVLVSKIFIPVLT